MQGSSPVRSSAVVEKSEEREGEEAEVETIGLLVKDSNPSVSKVAVGLPDTDDDGDSIYGTIRDVDVSASWGNGGPCVEAFNARMGRWI